MYEFILYTLFYICLGLKEHKRAVKCFDVNNALAQHCMKSGHSIGFNDFNVVSYCNNFRIRRVLESSFIKVNEANTMNLNNGFHQPDLVTAAKVVNCVCR